MGIGKPHSLELFLDHCLTLEHFRSFSVDQTGKGKSSNGIFAKKIEDKDGKEIAAPTHLQIGLGAAGKDFAWSHRDSLLTEHFVFRFYISEFLF